jgi:hypothetical protein
MVERWATFQPTGRRAQSRLQAQVSDTRAGPAKANGNNLIAGPAIGGIVIRPGAELGDVVLVDP